ncbi:MAG: amidohydrolase family protein [Rhodobacteraceae bacterium]|nr:amidohydrolase family protein [Paracoccaceae bacterium]
MPALLPPLRLTGAIALRDGRLRQRSVGIADGRFTSGPLPAVDLSGYLLLPGIVDLHAEGPRHRAATTAADLAHRDGEAASHGVTTRFLSVPWSWEGPGVAPPAAVAALAALTDYRSHALTDLRPQLACDALLTSGAGRLVDLVRDAGVELVLFTDRAARAQEMRLNDREAFDRLARTHGVSAEALTAALDGVLANSRARPRHLCDLAEAFDDLGVAYGSVGDDSAETREHFSMIGARFCLAPGTARAAAAAKAVGDPVLALAADPVAPDAAAPGPRLATLVQNGLCDALVSGTQSAAPYAAAFRLAELGLLPLERAWRLVSEAPAEIHGLPDRGTIAPGKRADLIVVHAGTRRVEATIAAGRLVFLTGEAANRFFGTLSPVRLAAE